MNLSSIVFGLLSFFASILILYTFGLFLPIAWLQDHSSLWLPGALGCLIGFLIMRKYKTRLG